MDGADLALREPWLLLLGSTGFLGQAILMELLRRGRRVLALVRAARPVEARDRVIDALRPWAFDVGAYLERGQLAVIRGDLHQPRLGLAADLADALRGHVGSLLVAAGSTSFRLQPDGEPFATNVEGTRRALETAAALGCRTWTLLSTAFVDGRGCTSEPSPAERRIEFRNDYERSKSEGERLARELAHRYDATLTVLRPSVVVGDSQSGIATRFAGAYYLFRATGLVARAARDRGEADLRGLRLRMPADAEGRPNLVFADDVAREAVELHLARAARGGTFYLTHPQPPSNRELQRALEEYFGIAGGAFLGANAQVPAPRSTYEEMFTAAGDGVMTYFSDTPAFDRSATDALVGRPPTPWTAERLRRLIAFADACGWRVPRSITCAEEPCDLADYFQRFLPLRLPASRAAAVPLALSARFVVGDRAADDWWCRFEGGTLREVRAGGAEKADVTYRTTGGAFLRAVAGLVSGAELFLSSEASIEGDIERGLKFARILADFVQEHPYQPPGPDTTR